MFTRPLLPVSRSIPIATSLVTAIAVVAAGLPEFSEILQLDWEAISRGQLWRLWTGHLVHWTPEHVFWDAVTFFVLGTLCERHHRGVFLASLALGLPAISWGLAGLCPEISIYRGLSGIDTGLFVWLILIQLRHGHETRQPGPILLWGLLLLGLLGKLTYEALTGSCLFVSSGEGTFRPLVESHLLGAFAGLLSFVGDRNRICRFTHSVGEPTAQLAVGVPTAQSPDTQLLKPANPRQSYG